MSWLGGSISSITGQLSNLTKDILTEGTEEVSDHATELQLTQVRLKELQGICSGQRSENDRLQQINRELDEKAEASELQINSISREYRLLLEEKENEVKSLKQKHHELLENQSKPSGGSHHDTDVNTALPGLDQTGYIGDDHDFSDGIYMQHEINRLRNEVERLRTENQRLHTLTKDSSNHDDVAQASHPDFVDQTSIIEDLRRQLSAISERHQHELSAYQDVHQQKLAALRRKQKQEMEAYKAEVESRDQGSQDDQELRNQIDCLEAESQTTNKLLAAAKEEAKNLEEKYEQLQQSTNEAESEPGQDELTTYKEALARTEAELVLLRCEIDQVRAALYWSEQRLLDLLDADALDLLGDVQQVRHQLDSDTHCRKEELLIERQAIVCQLETACSKQSQVRTEVEQIENVQQTLARETAAIVNDIGNPEHQRLTAEIINSLENENLILHERNVELQEHLVLLEKAVNILTEETQKSSSEADKEGELRKLTNDDDKIDNGNESESGQYENLRVQLEKLQEESKKWDVMKSDWMMEKAALEDALVVVRETLWKQEITLEEQQNLPKFESEQGAQLELLSQENSKLKLERDTLILEKQSILEELDIVKDENTQFEDSLRSFENQVSDSIDIKQDLQSKDEQLCNLTQEKEELEHSLEELDSQHDEAMGQLISARNKLQKNIEELRQTLGEREAAFKALTKQCAELESCVEEKDHRLEVLEKSPDALKQQQSESQKGQHKQDEKSEVKLVKLNANNEKLLEEVNTMKVQLRESTMAVNDLHMDKQELEKVIQKDKQDIAVKVAKLKEFRESNEDLQMMIKTVSENLTLSQNKIKVLEENNDQTSNIECENNLQKQIKHLQESEKQKSNEISFFSSKILKLNDHIATLVNDCENVHSDYENQRSECDVMSKLINTLENEKNALEKVKVQSEKKQKSEAVHYEAYIEEIKQSQALNSSSLHEEHSRALADNHSKERMISELTNHMQRISNETEEINDQLEASTTREQELSELLEEKESDFCASEMMISQQKKEINEQSSIIQDLHGKLGLLKELEANVLSKNIELQKQTIKLEELQEALSKSIERDNSQVHNEIVKLTNIVTKQELEISHLKQESLLQGNDVREYQETIGSLEHVLSIKEKQISILSSRLKESDPEGKEEDTAEMKASISQETSLEVIMPDAIEALDVASAFSCQHERKNSDPGSGLSLNGQDADDVSASELEDELDKLQQKLRDKDQVITELQSNNQTLLAMVEAKSLSSYGDRSLVDVHKLESEVSSLKLEREKMMAVLNEKSRECSSLKTEVHRLMNVVSVEKNALQKLQLDNHQLTQTKGDDSTHDHMQKEALQNLSRLIRDKDLEIEALSQKNETLLAVLQDSSDNGAQINTLMQDKSNLTKQLSVLQGEREQIVVYLNQKHQESLAYHHEIQKLTLHITQEKDKQDQLQQEYSSLIPQFEDKKQALLKAQNELINYKQKYTELEIKYGELVQRANISETVDMLTHNNKLQELQKLSEQMLEMKELAKEKDAKLHNLKVKFGELELALNSKDTEKNNLRKQVQNLTFHLQGVQTELNDLRSDTLTRQQKLSEQHAEISLLKDMNDQLTLTIREKEFEADRAKDKVTTITAVLQEQQGEKGQIDRLIHESESIQQHAQQFQQERDQMTLALKQRHAENEQLQKQVQILRERDVKLSQELSRLRNHLVQIEDGYTREALEAEEREKELRNRLAVVEEKLFSSTSAVESASYQAVSQVDALQQQLQIIAGQRDSAYMQVATTQDQCQQYATSLVNLQMVLEQFQRETDNQLSVELEKYQTELRDRKQNIKMLHSELQQTKMQLEEATTGLEAASRLSEQLDQREEAIVALKEEVHLRETALKAAEEEIHKLNTSTEAQVDKLIVKSLFLGYFSTPQDKREEVLRLIGRVLNFSREDFDKVSGDRNKSTWVPGFLRFRSGPASSPPSTPTRTVAQGLDKSFSELFVKFLEKESSPPPTPIRLPAEEMAKELQSKHKEASHRAAYNPFTAPRHAVMPAGMGRNSPHDSHILMLPASPTLPLFTPLSVSDKDLDHSRRTSTPLTSNIILKDVMDPH